MTPLQLQQIPCIFPLSNLLTLQGSQGMEPTKALNPGLDLLWAWGSGEPGELRGHPGSPYDSHCSLQEGLLLQELHAPTLLLPTGRVPNTECGTQGLSCLMTSLPPLPISAARTQPLAEKLAHHRSDMPGSIMPLSLHSRHSICLKRFFLFSTR